MRLPLKVNIDHNHTKIWFMSDLHLDHENILKINRETRPFNDMEEMKEYMIDTIKKTVKPGDILFDLGDLVWKDSGETSKLIRDLLPENSYKIIGNHDNQSSYRDWKARGDIFDFMVTYKKETIKLVVSHYPILDWNGRFHGSLNIHGHCHGNIDIVNQESGELRFDVGFDSIYAKENGSFLIPFEFIYEKAKSITHNQDFHDWAKTAFK